MLLKLMMTLLVGVTIGLNLITGCNGKTEDAQVKYIKTLTKYIETLERHKESSDEYNSTLRTVRDYYKKAYEDTINEYVKLAKTMNRRNE